jgi:hypothetical protein
MPRLQINNVGYSAPAENMVAPLCSVAESEMNHKATKVIKTNISIRRAT